MTDISFMFKLPDGDQLEANVAAIDPAITRTALVNAAVLVKKLAGDLPLGRELVGVYGVASACHYLALRRAMMHDAAHGARWPELCATLGGIAGEGAKITAYVAERPTQLPPVTFTPTLAADGQTPIPSSDQPNASV